MMSSNGTEGLPLNLKVVRIVRGVLEISLGLIYYTLVQSYYAHHYYINFPIGVNDPLMAGFVGPLMILCFVIGPYDVIYQLSNTTIPYYTWPILGISMGLELIMIIILWSLGMLILPGYILFVFFAVLQFLLFCAFFIIEIYTLRIT